MPRTNCRFDRRTKRCSGTDSSPSSEHCEPAPVVRNGRATCRRNWAPGAGGPPPPTAATEMARRIVAVCMNPKGATRSRGGLNVGDLRAQCAARGIVPPLGHRREDLVALLCAHPGAARPVAVPFAPVTTGAFAFGPAKRVAVGADPTTGRLAYSSFPRIIFRNGAHATRLVPERVLGSGSFGVVVRYTGDDGRAYVAKIENVDPPKTLADTEAPVVGQLEGVACGQIHARVAGTARYHFRRRRGVVTLLEEMDGDLRMNIAVVGEYATAHGVSYEEGAVRILEEVRRQIMCLLGANGSHAYVDLKLANVLFRRLPGGGVEIKLGDLGSMAPDSAGEYTMTYPCLPTGRTPAAFATMAEKRACIAYQLGLFLASMLGIDLTSLYHEAHPGATTATDAVRIGIEDELEDEPVALQRLANLAHEDPAMRPDITAPFI